MSNNKDFNALREHAAPNTGTYIRATDALANKGQTISFLHTPSGRSVFFKAFITAFNETYSSDWSEENVLGRADGIHMFKSTTRSVSLAFKVPAATRSEAYENLSRVQTLIQFLYPSYEDPENALTINQSPLIRLRVMNLLTKGDASQTFADIFGASGGLSMDPAEGLLGVIGNVTVNHNLETDVGVIEAGTGSTILPKLMEVNVDFNVIHEATLGWSNEGIDQNKFGAGAGSGFHGGFGGEPENMPYGLSDPKIVVDQRGGFIGESIALPLSSAPTPNIDDMQDLDDYLYNESVEYDYSETGGEASEACVESEWFPKEVE
jgi:hypothetical protein